MAENEEVVVADAAVDPPVVDAPVADAPAPVVEDGAPKSIAEAIEAGLDAVPARTKEEQQKAADKLAGKPEGTAAKPDGKDEKKDGDKDAAKEGEQKDEKKDEKVDPDHINDPIPKELSERAQERIRSLVGYVKERDEALVTQGNIINAIQRTGTSAEEFATTIQYLEAFHSKDPAQLEKCLGILQRNMEDVALRLGRDVPGIDFLAQHKDLQEAVRYGQITQQHANEIARARTAQARTQAFEQQRSQTEQTEVAAKAEKDGAITALNELGSKLKASDPDYQRKFDALVAPLREAFQHMPPRNWKAAFEAAYAKIKLPPAAPAAAATPPDGMVRDPQTGQFVKKNVPIRPVSPAAAGNAKAQPKSALEAMEQAWDNMA